MTSEAHDVVVETKSALDDAERRGTQAVTIEQVRALIDLIETALQGTSTSTSTAFSLEQYKAQLQAWGQLPGRTDAFTLEEARQVATLGQSALNSSLLVNGGASVALLAFLGHLSTFEALRPFLGAFASSLMLFGSGVLSSAIASGSAFLTGRFSQSKSPKAQAAFDALSIALVIWSYIAFGWACWTAYRGFTTLSTSP